MTPSVMTTIRESVQELLAIVDHLQQTYPKKRFTLDGRLVGDIGETLVEQTYAVDLLEGVQKHHDARSHDGRLVQIKATLRSEHPAFTFPADHVPDYYLAIVIHPDGGFKEIFNGPGKVAAQAVQGRKHPKTNLHAISVSALLKLAGQVDPKDRIPRRT